MAENLKHKHEHSRGQEHRKEHAEHQKNLQETAEHAAKNAKHEHADNIESIRSKVEAASKSKQEGLKKNKEREKSEKDQPTLVNKELKALAYKRTLHRMQRKLPAPSRAFSKVIHNPVVETVSDVTGKTVARPSGVLAGGIFAFLGSSLFLYITKHYGYEYNYLLFALFFVGGFFVGLLVELGLRLSNRKAR